jgi:hypothetical protein
MIRPCREASLDNLPRLQEQPDSRREKDDDDALDDEAAATAGDHAFIRVHVWLLVTLAGVTAASATSRAATSVI